jgi:hypothetical protein
MRHARVVALGAAGRVHGLPGEGLTTMAMLLGLNVSSHSRTGDPGGMLVRNVRSS